MTKKALLVGTMVVFSWLPAWGQESDSRWEIFAGPSLTGAPGNSESEGYVWVGWQASALRNVHGSLGFKLDLAGHYSEDRKLQGYQYLIGPQFSLGFSSPGNRSIFREHNRTFFLHALFGGSRREELRSDGGLSFEQALSLLGKELYLPRLMPQPMNSLLVCFGGGLDARIGKHVAIRVLQMDLILRRVKDYFDETRAWKNDGRISAGIVLRFGNRS